LARRILRHEGSNGFEVRVRQSNERRLPSWRAEELRTTLWIVPVLCVIGAVVLFVATYIFDKAVYRGDITLPGWISTGSADAGRQVLIAIAASVITVIGVVYSITILALTLASQQFGPRMLRNFVRDVGIQLTLGVFVASFVYAVLTLGSISAEPGREFVPHLSIAVTEVLMFVDIAFLIYFIHHVARTIQLPVVVARIARDLARAIDESFPPPAAALGALRALPDEGGPSVEELVELLEREGVTVPATKSGYLQFVGYAQLVGIAAAADATMRLAHRVGHFVVSGRPLALVWPPTAAADVAGALAKSHITGPHRTLAQDPVFPIDQLAEIATRALSPAVNDTFTALTCIDWLADGLCRISGREIGEGVYRDHRGRVRLIEHSQSYARMVNRAFDKIRQSSRGVPAVIIRLVDAVHHVIEYTTDGSQRQVLLRQAEMVMREAEETVAEERDLADIRLRYERLKRTVARLDEGELEPRVWPVPERD
jgi:uncharacterized membrane protein